MNEIHVKENQHLFLPLLWTGKETELLYDIILAGRSASVKLYALLLGKEEQSVRVSITVTHSYPDTISEVIVKGALTDKAQINFEGLVKIDAGAKGTNAWLAAHILLLSQKAKGLAIPSLEILENDIKAGHATTVGKVNDAELFYLMSRGLPQSTAKQLIIEGFMQSLLTDFPEDMKHMAKKELVGYALQDTKELV